MNFFPFNLIAAAATGAAVEAGRGIARRSGLGFAAGESGGDEYGDYDYLFDYGGNYDGVGAEGENWGGWFEDQFGNYWEYDWFNLPVDDTLRAETLSIDTFAPFKQPDYRDITGELDYRDNIWDWLTKLGPSPAQPVPQYGPAGTGQGLPGYCPRGTYHPINDPFACVPFPANDPNAKKQASSQQKTQQAAANAAKKAQQAQDKACPKDPQGRAVWRNPQTGKCELVPQCPPGAKFDSATKRCLTAAQAKELYGESNWWLWLLLGAGALVVISSGNNGGGRRR